MNVGEWIQSTKDSDGNMLCSRYLVDIGYSSCTLNICRREPGHKGNHRDDAASDIAIIEWDDNEADKANLRYWDRLAKASEIE